MAESGTRATFFVLGWVARHETRLVRQIARCEQEIASHGSSHRKRAVEGPQLCHRMKPVQPELIRGVDFVAVKTTYRYEYAAPGRRPGSRWTQLIVFPRGERYFFLMDEIDSVNDSDEMFLRNDTPGCVRHVRGDTFSEIYLSYLPQTNDSTWYWPSIRRGA